VADALSAGRWLCSHEFQYGLRYLRQTLFEHEVTSAGNCQAYQLCGHPGMRRIGSPFASVPPST
jgi:hypothetical protein